MTMLRITNRIDGNGCYAAVRPDDGGGRPCVYVDLREFGAGGSGGEADRRGEACAASVLVGRTENGRDVWASAPVPLEGCP